MLFRSNTTSEGLYQTEQTPGAGAKIAYRPTRPIGRWMCVFLPQLLHCGTGAPADAALLRNDSMGPTLEVSEESDWTGVVRINGLWASTEYECAPFSPHPLRRKQP